MSVELEGLGGGDAIDWGVVRLHVVEIWLNLNDGTIAVQGECRSETLSRYAEPQPAIALTLC